MKQFDQVIENQYGIINGNKNLFFIKTGRGGSIFGYENKYLNICSIFSEKTGSAFVVSANSEDSEYDIEDELEHINIYVGDYEDVFYDRVCLQIEKEVLFCICGSAGYSDKYDRGIIRL